MMLVNIKQYAFNIKVMFSTKLKLLKLFMLPVRNNRFFKHWVKDERLKLLK